MAISSRGKSGSSFICQPHHLERFNYLKYVPFIPPPPPAYRSFSHDVTAAMLVHKNKGMAAILVHKTNPLGIELYFYANTFFCFIEPIWPLVMQVKMIYTCTNCTPHCQYDVTFRLDDVQNGVQSFRRERSHKCRFFFPWMFH